MGEQGIFWLPGVQDLFAQLAEAGIPCGIVSNAWRKLIAITVAGLPPGAVKVSVTGDEMLRAKPDPWSYAHAAELLDIPAENIIAIEDSLSGTLSAEAANMHVLVVPSVTEVPAGPGRSRTKSLEGITVDTLRAIVSGHVLELAAT
jgi:HAD superfamily hydrolase (TIGR01509 family)